MKYLLTLCLLVVAVCTTQAQIDSGFVARINALNNADLLKEDTLAPPNDGLTKKIRTLFQEHGGIDIQGIIKIKLAEERGKNAGSAARLDSIEQEFTSGETGRLLEHCLVNIYRRTFSEDEVDELLRFYRTSAGKKLNRDYLLLLVQSVKDLELLLEKMGKIK